MSRLWQNGEYIDVTTPGIENINQKLIKDEADIAANTSAISKNSTDISTINSNLGQKVDNTSQEAHIVFNSYDFNKYSKSGFYRINSGSSYSNIPSTDASWGQLIVSANGDTVMQLYVPITTSGVWVRCFQVTSSGYNYTNWKKLAFA